MRFEMVRKVFRNATGTGAILQMMRTGASEESPVLARDKMILEALNSLPLRQRLINYEVIAEGLDVVVDMYVENMA